MSRNITKILDNKRLTLFYDGLCPLCQAEILFLSRRNQRGLLQFIDINSNYYHPDLIGISCENALESMYAQFDDGRLISGIDVFAETYRRADLRWLAWLLSISFFKPLFRFGYRLFARNRHKVSRVFGPWLLKLVTKSRIH